MAKQTLPINFVDDILAQPMGGKRKFAITDNGDGTYSIEDVTEYTQIGSDFGASQMNQTNQAVNESCDKADVIDDYDDVIANKSSGKIAGALALAYLSSKITVNASDEFGKKTITTSAWGAVIHSIILPEAGTYLVGADYSGTNVCFVSAGGGENKYLMPGGTALVTVDGYTVVDFKSNTSLQAVWTEFLPFYVRLM